LSEQSLTHLVIYLKAAGTPKQIVDAFEHGFQLWDGDNPPVALTASQLGTSATLLTTTFHEQVHHIGWLHLHLGHLSHHWQQAFLALLPTSNPSMPQNWLATIVSLLWK